MYYLLLRSLYTIFAASGIYLTLTSPHKPSQRLFAHHPQVQVGKLEDDAEKNTNIPIFSKDQILLQDTFDKEDKIQKWLVIHRNIATVITLIEAFLIAALLINPSDGLSAFVAENFCPQTALPCKADLSTLSLPFVIGWVLLFAGSLIRICAFITLDSKASQGKLITSGLFSMVRHPAHSGVILLGIGILCIRFDPYAPLWSCGLFARYPTVSAITGAWMATAVGCMYWLVCVQASTEENNLKEVFGEEWKAYCKKVPYKVVPGLI